MEKDEIKETLNKRYSLRSISGWDTWLNYNSGCKAVKDFLQSIIKDLATNIEVASLIKSYPDKFIGLGSVASTKSEEYVEWIKSIYNIL